MALGFMVGRMGNNTKIAKDLQVEQVGVGLTVNRYWEKNARTLVIN